jgi:type IV secretory pathway protease TraF
MVDPERPTRWLVKRVISATPGLYGRTARGLAVDPAGNPLPTSDIEPGVELPKGTVWVQGDALDRSRDSRHFGAVPLRCVVGRAVRIYDPLGRRREL